MRLDLSRRRAPRCPRFRASGHRKGDPPQRAALGHAGAAGRQDRLRCAHRDAWLGPGRSAARRDPAGSGDDGRAARLGQDDHRRKIAKRLKEKDRKKILMASLDVNRPAAQEQLATLGTQTEIATLPIVAGQRPVEIASRAMQAAKLQGYDVLILDTAGRLHVDQALMDEMKAIADVSNPRSEEHTSEL